MEKEDQNPIEGEIGKWQMQEAMARRAQVWYSAGPADQKLLCF